MEKENVPDIENNPILAAFLTLTPDAVVIIDESGTILYGNQELCKMFDYKKENLINNKIEMLLPERYRNKHIQHRSHFFQEPKKRPMGINKILVGLNRSNIEIPVEISLSHMKIENIMVAIGIIRDLTERKKLETNLYGILESAPDGILMINIDGKIVLANSQIEKLFQYNRNEILNHPIETLIPERFHTIHKHHRTNYMKNPTTRPMGFNKELVGRREDGTELPVEISLSPVTINGELNTIAIVRDITEKKKLEINLYSILESAPDGILIINNDGTIVLANSQIEKLFQYNRNEILNHPIETLIPERFRTIHKHHRTHYMENPTTRPMGINKELVGRQKNGAELPVEISLSPVSIYGEVNTIAIVRDITVKKAYEYQIVEAKETAVKALKVKSDFLANMSHEIRTPMHGIIGLTEILIKSDLNSEQLEYIDTIKQCTDSLLYIINNILDISKIETNTLHLNYNSRNLYDLCKQIQKIVQLMFNTKSDILLNYNINISSDLVVLVDDERLKQIILNLVTNAFKFTEHGVVDIYYDLLHEDSDNCTLKFLVSDTGVGIPLDKRENLFQLFSQADISLTKRYPGTGLGLFLCKNLLNLMNGSINYNSVSGKGSTFWFELKLEKVKKSDENESSSKTSTKSSTNKVILVVEDNKINLLIAKKLLTSLGYIVDEAYDGLEAVEKTKKNYYDLIFMDIQMPNMNGYDATKCIRNLNYKGPIIALTASAFPSDIEKSFLSGMNDHLSKPVTLNILKEIIQKWIS